MEKVPREQYGQFYEGDSYIVLNVNFVLLIFLLRNDFRQKLINDGLFIFGLVTKRARFVFFNKF